MKKKNLEESEILLLIDKSLQETKSSQQVEVIKKKYLEKGGVISQLFKQVSQEKDLVRKKRLGSLINKWKNELTAETKKIEEKVTSSRKEKESEKVDIFLPGKKIAFASLHPLTQIIQKIYDVLIPLGYQITESPEIENEECNFNKLNMPAEHPARDMHDTFYLNNNLLLRTHTTNIQSRVLSENPNTELKIISAGKVYRRDDDDTTHTHQFTQVDCFMVGKNVSFSHLKGTLELLVKELFGQQQTIRFRPSYFPFTEPSVEVDAACVKCQQKGCEICKKSGWVEIAGAGLIYPQVLKNCGFDAQTYSGFAFAFGLERLLMIKYRIEDIRHFYLNDIRFLSQFSEL